MSIEEYDSIKSAKKNDLVLSHIKWLHYLTKIVHVSIEE